MSGAPSQGPTEDGPDILITGRPSAAETAAVVAALVAVSQAPAGDRPSVSEQRSLWNSRIRATRPPLSPGPGAWQATRLPR
ncbi:MAG TPA: acyl-CoA carboxylase epsilon subunit [Ornithinimicrobium sp.]|uniref:acyl-CoA carboxylase epsilon subunit n=1 Tax=Ornithinimicrobium sp. TaxID=1977084 RepID=UPI002B46DEB5|nr:acyl-CoA carboxylase epsilon subunit [Ornithinimicrobium sp.]HKJ12627.1 acyl-CoA carboxylase epsilon subunit [Ornithinimicrobium sp.]